MAIELYTPSQERANIILNQGGNVQLTGKPGTGKTALLEDFIEHQRALGRKVLVTASTGIAAASLDGGRTLHSALRWNPNRTEYDYNKCSELLQQADILIVDEDSMLTPDILRHLMECLRVQERRPQIILAGDFFQLPPVKAALYPFETGEWSLLNLQPCILQDVVRQTDAEFKAMLEKAMLGDPSCISYFRSKTNPRLIEGAITLCTRNDLAKDINDKKMSLLCGTPKLYFAAGDAQQADFTKSKVENCLRIKKHMRVMALRNDSQGRYQNGSLGTVMDMAENSIRVRFDNGQTVDIVRCKYEVDAKAGEQGTVTVEQFPLKGGYAITIHKSQGQTFDAINIKAPQCWEAGQLYVALSRARTIGGIHLLNDLRAEDLKTDQRVVDFYHRLLMGYAA